MFGVIALERIVGANNRAYTGKLQEIRFRFDVEPTDVNAPFFYITAANGEFMSPSRSERAKSDSKSLARIRLLL